MALLGDKQENLKTKQIFIRIAEDNCGHYKQEIQMSCRTPAFCWRVFGKAPSTLIAIFLQECMPFSCRSSISPNNVHFLTDDASQATFRYLSHFTGQSDIHHTWFSDSRYEWRSRQSRKEEAKGVLLYFEVTPRKPSQDPKWNRSLMGFIKRCLERSLEKLGFFGV